MKSKRVLWWLALCGCVLLAGAIVGCSPEEAVQGSEPPKPRELSINAWGGTYEELLKEYIVEPFEREYGIKVNVVLGDMQLARLAQEGDSPTLDVVLTWEEQVTHAEELGIMQGLDFANIPHIRDLYREAWWSPFGVVVNWGAYGIAYDTTKVDVVPTSWLDLWRPEFEGEVMIWDVDIESTIDILTFVAEKSIGREVASIEDYESAFEILPDLRQNIYGLARSYSDVEAAFSRGDISMAVCGSSRAEQMAIRGLPLDFVYPVEGAPPETTIVGITMTKHKYWAEKLVDYMLRPEVQKAYAEKGSYAPSNKNVEVSPDVSRFMPYGPERVRSLKSTNWEVRVPLRDGIIERFNQAMKQ